MHAANAMNTKNSTGFMRYPLFAIRYTKKGFSMVEMMITVVIVSVCLVMALRGFSLCAKYVSEAYNTTYASEILQSKMNELKEKAVIEGGINVFAKEEIVFVDDRKFILKQEAFKWEKSEEKDQEDDSTVLRKNSFPLLKVNMEVM